MRIRRHTATVVVLAGLAFPVTPALAHDSGPAHVHTPQGCQNLGNEQENAGLARASHRADAIVREACGH